ncbi:MAG: GNAT family N-acetyltransferase [Candidatus Nanopelagicales bacterium]
MAEVRAAVAEDAEGVARVHVTAWQAAYHGVLAQDYLDNLQWEKRYEFWSRELVEPGNRRTRTWVLAEGATVLGFASIGPARDDDRQWPGAWELYAIYLLPEHWHRGWGRALTRQALDDLPPDVVDVSLWVLSENEAARAFYERLRFIAYGPPRWATVGGRDVAEVRYLKDQISP